MPIYSFDEIIGYFSEKLQTTPPQEDLDAGEVEIVVDQNHILISKGAFEGGLSFSLTLGLMLQPIREARLKELATANFLGIDTGGCTLAFDEAGVALTLFAHLTPPISPQECWEWLHRLLHVGTAWNKNLIEWEEFVPLQSLRREKVR